MQGKVWRHTGGMLLPCNLCVFAELLCRLQPVLFPGGASLQLHAGWESSQDPQFDASSWWATSLQVCVKEWPSWCKSCIHLHTRWDYFHCICGKYKQYVQFTCFVNPTRAMHVLSD